MLVGLAAATLRPRLAVGAGPVVVEDWGSQPLGSRGVPQGWRSYETPGGHPRYDFTIVEDGGHRALELKSDDDHSTVAKEVDVDLGVTPDSRMGVAGHLASGRGGSDQARDVRRDRSHLRRVAAVSGRAPVAADRLHLGPRRCRRRSVKSQKTGTVSFVVARSGPKGFGEWSVERHDVAADYKRVYGETAPKPGAVALSIDTNDTRASAVARFGRIALVSR